ncbi:hypothetical protein Acr_00g0030180 [Actinidia rufa]|uniref:RNase H type-1 domain-containing protein n=1 Tax=Actinidia rufa TaxID=165716 RepID=A0A7J0DF95_9ERIC|nr:hypothetical protein Acr_00g0030180 [Actinidia rufa]
MYLPKSNSTIGCSPQIFTITVWRHLWERQFSTFYTPVQPLITASSPLDNEAYPMASTIQAPDLEGIHREIHAANSPPPAALIPDIKQSHQSHSTGRVRRERRRLPSPPRRESSSSSKSRSSSKILKVEGEEARRGRSSRRSDQTRCRNTSTSQQIQDLDARLDTINTGLPTQLAIYEGKTIPMDHLDSYKSLMSLQGCSKRSDVQGFFCHFEGIGEIMVRKLPPGTIDSFGDLKTEGLKDYVKLFNQAVLEVEDPSDKVVIMAMMEGLQPGPLFDSLSKNVPKTLFALQSKADKYMAIEELAEAKRLVLQNPSGEQMEYAIRIGFKATNNEAKYEALLADLRVATELGVNSLDVFNDSQLVVNQVQGDYLAKDTRMMAYLDEADALANLASAFNFISDRNVPLEYLAHPSIEVAKLVYQAETGSMWIDDIVAYLQTRALPSDKL